MVFQNRGMRYSCCGCVCVCVCVGAALSRSSHSIYGLTGLSLSHFPLFFRFDFSVLRVVSSSFNSNVYFKEIFFLFFRFF